MDNKQSKKIKKTANKPKSKITSDGSIKKQIAPVNLSSEYKKLELAKQLNREQIDLLLNIKSFLQEYLDDFIVLGHALNGHRVNITHAVTPKDLDSLEQYYTDNLILLKNQKLKDL